MNLLNKLKLLYHEYPRQYWLMITGVVISTAGGSMIWPFLLIYASGKLDLPLSTVATLISINAGTGLLSSLVAGTLADKIGRKVVMNFSLTVNGLAYFLLMNAETYPQFVGLMIMIGLSNPLYHVGADAMLADMIPSEKRTDAFAINRIANNAAFALGPAMGGFLATRSYDLAFYCAGIGFLTYSMILFFLAHETLNTKNLTKASLKGSVVPTQPSEGSTVAQTEGYRRVFQDKGYMTFVGLLSLGLIAPTMLWILMPVYAKTNYGIPEALYGWIPTTNAVMCVFVQYWVTSITRQHRTLPVLSADVDLCPGCRKCRAHEWFLGILAEHGHPDLRRAYSFPASKFADPRSLRTCAGRYVCPLAGLGTGVTLALSSADSSTTTSRRAPFGWEACSSDSAARWDCSSSTAFRLLEHRLSRSRSLLPRSMLINVGV
jgi:MFS family permease